MKYLLFVKDLRFLVPLLFFVISIFTLKDYGISWDEPIHFHRGQAYLYYFLTGKKNFKDLPKIAEHRRARAGENYLQQGYISVKDFRRSYYQDDTLTTEYFLREDAGHPPLNGILASLFNYIFYQKLGIMGDINSHHIFNIVASTLLVFVVVSFAYALVGLWGAIGAGASLILYPLFFAESHFNIKDPPEAAFFAGTIWAFWISIKKKSTKWLVLSALFCALALGTKFNAFFIPVIIGLWLPFYFSDTLLGGYKRIVRQIKKIPPKYFIGLVSYPLIVIGIFFATWPFLWQAPIENFLEIFGYYKDIGTGTDYQSSFLVIKGLNLYPLYWIVTTTPPVILVLGAIGLVISIFSLRKKREYLLILIWFILPILRVSLPGTTIYGGIRQILEFLPALALLCGIALAYLVQKRQKVALFLIFLGFLYTASVMIKMHPHQNVYFNSFVGGLAGAKEKGVPYWGNSFGNAYWDALQWLNKHAERNAKLALVQGTGLNMPQMMLRSDIQYWNNYWSGINREGEYLLELTHQDPVIVYQYAWDYVNTFLEPVYEVKVDGVAIAKLWKNDAQHTKPSYRKNETIHQKNINQDISQNSLTITLPQELAVTRLSISYKKTATCIPVSGIVSISRDGKNWKAMSEPVPFPQISGDLSVNDNEFNYFFAAKPAAQIRFQAYTSESCLFENPTVKVYSIDAQ